MKMEEEEEDSFIHDLMCSLPSLTPLWHDLSHQQTIRSKNGARFARAKLPDFGGAGIDVIQDKSDFICKETKYINNNFGYAAVTCSLPFIPANKVLDISDPCLAPVKKANDNLRKFSRSLHMSRLSYKNKNNVKYRKKIMSAYNSTKIMYETNKFEKVVVPESVVRLAGDFPEKTVLSPINMSYAGGCLAISLSRNENHIILHSTGEKLNKLGFIPIKVSDETDKHFKPTLTEENSIKLKGGRIMQIAKAIDGFCYVRQEKNYHFLDFNDPINVSMTRFSPKSELMSIAASPYNPSDYIVIYSQGNLELCNLEQSEPVVEFIKDQYTSPFSEIDTIQCSFGSHFESVLCLNEKHLFSFDLRFKDYKKKTLFSSDYDSCYLNEKLISFKSLALHSYQHVVSSTNHMFVCDERYPKRPVLIYNHSLKGYPLYCDSAVLKTGNNASDVLAIIGTQDSNELCAFSIRTNSSVQPVSLSPPIHLSSTTDCGESLKLQCIPVEDTLMQRLAYPLIGISVLSHTRGTGFTAFQLNSLGDLFYQDFRENHLQGVEKTRKVDMGCILTPANLIQPHLTNFLPITEREESPKFSLSRLVDSRIVEVDINLVEFFNAMKNVPSQCETCNPDKDPTIINFNTKQSVPCPACGFDEVQSQNLNNTFQKLGLLSGPAKKQSMMHNLDISPLYECKDSLSNKLLTAWDYPDNESDPDTVHFDSDFSFATSTPNSPSHSENSDSNQDTLTTSLSSESKEAMAKRLFNNISSVNFVTKDFPTTDSMGQIKQCAHPVEKVKEEYISPSQELMGDYIPRSQELIEEYVPPSQEVRPFIGETLRTPKRLKLSNRISNRENAGF